MKRIIIIIKCESNEAREERGVQSKIVEATDYGVKNKRTDAVMLVMHIFCSGKLT